MAEVVQNAIEGYIQDLSTLERYELFTSNEIKSILSKRTEFEYRLRKRQKSKDDFLRYIAYEESLLKLIRIRREKSTLEIDRSEVEKSVIEQIRKLYEFTINKFKSDIPLWLSYISFSKGQNHLDHVSKIYFRMIQVHNKDWLWLQFAKFEFEEKASSETARKIFLRAISFHPESQQIWHEYFRFELLYCSKIRKRYMIITDAMETSEKTEIDFKQSNDGIWNGQLAIVVYTHAIDSCSDFEFAIRFLEICYKFDSEIVQKAKETILDDLKTRFGSCEDYWNVIALDKMHLYKQMVRYAKNPLTTEQQLSLKQKSFVESISIFEKACHNFENTKILADLKDTTNSQILARKISEIIFTIEKLWKEQKIELDIFKEWIKLIYSCNKKDVNTIQKLKRILKEASDRWPENLSLHLFIACLMSKLRLPVNEIDKFFQDSLYYRFTKVDKYNMDVMIDFWQLYIDWSISVKQSYHKIMKVINQLNRVCINAPRQMSEHFKTKLLTTIYHVFGIDKTRSYYESNKTVSPISMTFIQKMMVVEKHYSEMQEEGFIDLNERLKTLHEDLVHHFGMKDVQIWLDYIRHMMSVDMVKVGPLYDRALRNLDSSLCQQFVQQYSLLRSTHSPSTNTNEI
ncbi:U3 snoRNP protein [Blomia tropicalis]|nr:U3 snoRNP protein [Blomia tropicalis]